MERANRWPAWFRKWQAQFYTSKEWIALRNRVRDKYKMRCRECGRMIRGKSVVDHVREITPENYRDEGIVTGEDNLTLLCIECHNKKTFGGRMDFGLEKREDVNLF